MATRYITEYESKEFVWQRVVDNDPYEKMFDLLYFQEMRDPDEIADALNYKVSFVERYIESLKKKGWIIEKGKKMQFSKK